MLKILHFHFSHLHADSQLPEVWKKITTDLA